MGGGIEYSGPGGGGHRFVRRCLASGYAPDYTQATVVCNGVWQINALNFAAIIPVGAVAVALLVYALDNAAGQIAVRTSAACDNNAINTFVPVLNISGSNTEVIAIDPDRLVDFFGANQPFTVIAITVIGWWI